MELQQISKKPFAETEFSVGMKNNQLELVPLEPLEQSDSCRLKPTIGILGNGNYGKALGIRLNEAGMSVLVGTRDPSRRKFLPDHAELITYLEAAERADIVFVCLPVSSYDAIIPDLRGHLAGKIVVDVSNPSHVNDVCGAYHLDSLLPRSKVLKGLNTVPAWALESDAFGGSRETYVCGNDWDAKQRLMQLLQEVGFTPVDRGGLKAAVAIEQFSLKLFPEWRIAVTTTLILAFIFTLYYYIQLFAQEKAGLPGFKRIALFHVNRIICWIALWLFSIVYLAGALAGFFQLCNGTKYKPFPKWLDTLLKSRKQLGLIGLLCATMHLCLSLIVLGTEQATYMSQYQKIPGTEVKVFMKLHLKEEPSLLFALLAFSSFAVLGIASLPAVNARMSWREWDHIQSRLGHLGLFFATVHVFIYGIDAYDPKRLFTKPILPPAVFFQPLFPMIVLLMKFILILPGIRHHLAAIRNGWERKTGERTTESI